MNLDDFQSFPSLDPEGMLAHIDGLPDQLLSAWKLGNQYPRPPFTFLAYSLHLAGPIRRRGTPLGHLSPDYRPF